MQWCRCVAQSLNMLDQLEELQQRGRVAIARHHWSPQQLKFLDGGKRPSTPLSRDMSQRVSGGEFVLDEHHHHHQHYGTALVKIKQRTVVRYFVAPNYPAHRVAEWADATRFQTRQAQRRERDTLWERQQQQAFVALDRTQFDALHSKIDLLQEELLRTQQESQQQLGRATEQWNVCRTELRLLKEKEKARERRRRYKVRQKVLQQQQLQQQLNAVQPNVEQPQHAAAVVMPPPPVPYYHP